MIRFRRPITSSISLAAALVLGDCSLSPPQPSTSPVFVTGTPIPNPPSYRQHAHGPTTVAPRPGLPPVVEEPRLPHGDPPIDWDKVDSSINGLSTEIDKLRGDVAKMRKQQWKREEETPAPLR